MSKRISANRVAASKTKVLWEHIKKSVKHTYSLLGDKDNFVALYQNLYPNLWLDVLDFHNDIFRWNQKRISNHNTSVYKFVTAEDFLSDIAKSDKHKAKLGRKHFDSDEDRIAEITATRSGSLTKLHSRLSKTDKRERYIQHMTPDYVSSHANIYYRWRKKYPMDIDSRYLIVHEVAKYKCDATISFLETLVRCEKNLPMQHYAWECLNRLGVTGVHKGRRKGKKKASYIKGYTEINTPQELLKAIYNSPLEKMKHYDIFLSHSYKDKEALLKIKDVLNAHGLNVYLDWVNDKDEMPRSTTCKETAAVLTERIKSSTIILYIHTESSLYSRWTPWELGFAYALHKPIFVYKPADCEEPEYLQLYEDVELRENQLLVKESNVSIKEWIDNKK